MYKVTVSIEEQKFNGVFIVDDAMDAALKAVNNVYVIAGDSLSIITSRIELNAESGEATFVWCQNDPSSYCKVEIIK